LSPKKIGDDPLEGLDMGGGSIQSGDLVSSQLNQSDDLKKLIGSLAITLLSVGMLVGGFLLSQANEHVGAPSPTVGSTALVEQPSTAPPITSTSTRAPDTATATSTEAPPTPTATSTFTLEPTATAVPPTATPVPPTPTARVSQPLPQPTKCVPQAYWFAHTVKRGETLFSLSRRCNATVATVQHGNCMTSNTIYVGQVIYLPCPPPQPTLRPTAVPAPVSTCPPLPTQAGAPTPTPSPTASSCIRPTIVEFYAAPPPEGSTARFVLRWTIHGADRAQIFGHTVNPQSGTFEVWDSNVNYWVLWAKVDGTPDDCYAEYAIQIDPDSIN